MFVGHVAGAELLQSLSPETPAWVSMVGVGFPDFLWGVAVLAGIERVEIDPASPLVKDIRFVHYPWSHSLVLTNLIALVPATIVGLLYGTEAAVVFVLASMSHWLLDAIVHLGDLPVLGFGRDVKVGLGLWRYGRLSFVLEYAIFAAATLLWVTPVDWPAALAAGLLFHLVNINSFFGFTKDNPVKSGRVEAAGTLLGYAALAVVFTVILQR